MRAYYSTRWRARGDHSPRATVPQQPLRSLYIGVRAARVGSHCSCLFLVRVYLETRFSLSLCGFLSLSLSLWISLPALSASLSAPFARSLCVVLRRSIAFYIGAVDRIRQDRVSACLHLGGPRPPRLSALYQLALPASIATYKNRQQIIFVYKYDILLAIFCAGDILLAIFLPYTVYCTSMYSEYSICIKI